MTERNTLFRRLAAGVGAIALATVGLLGATNAYAENGEGENGTTNPPVVNLGNIDTTQNGKLVIHKSSANPGDPGDGTELSPAPAGPLDGVKFTIKRVTYKGTPIDLTTYQGWVDAQGATTANVTAGTGDYGLVAGDGVTVETGSNGIATFNPTAGGDGFGLYYVEETDPGDNPIVSPVVPFLVAIPYPNDSGWLYTVHVYPKNKLDTDEPSKEVTDPGHHVVVGDTITWTITKTLPALAAGSTFNKLVITDELDSRLSIAADDVTVTHDGVELTEGADKDYTLAISGTKVTITFTETGLGKLASGKDVVVTLDSKVESLGDDAVFENTATVNVNNAEHDTNTPGVYWGSVEVLKQDAANQMPLKGAIFEIYDAKNGDLVAGPLTTGDDGTLTFEGLWVGSINDVDDFPAAGMSRDYWLKEVQAAPGYVTPTAGDDAWTKVTVNADGTTTVKVTSQTINNTKQDGPNLPQTGSTGSLVMVLVGLGLVGAAGAMFAARRLRASN